MGDRTATNNGTAGTTNKTVIVGVTISHTIHWETAAGELDNYTVPAGNWVIRLNVTTFNAAIDWTDTYVCRVNSSGVSQSTIGHDNTVQTLDTNKVYSATVSGSADTPSAGDRIYIVLGLHKNTPTGTTNVTYKPNQTIDTPMVSNQPSPPNPVCASADIFSPGGPAHPLGPFPPYSGSGPGITPITVGALETVGLSLAQVTPPGYPFDGEALAMSGVVPIADARRGNPVYAARQRTPPPSFFPEPGWVWIRKGITVYVPVAPKIPPGTPQVSIQQQVPSPFPPQSKDVWIFYGAPPVPNVKTPLPVISFQVTPQAFPPPGQATSLQGRFQAAIPFAYPADPGIQASQVVPGFFPFPGVTIYMPVGRIPVADIMPPEINVPPQVTSPEFPATGSGIAGRIVVIVPPANVIARQLSISASQVVAQPFPPDGIASSIRGVVPVPNVKPPPSVPPPDFSRETLIPPPAIFPPPGSTFYLYVGIVTVPTVKTPLPVRAMQSLPAPFPAEGEALYRKPRGPVPIVKTPPLVLAQQSVPPQAIFPAEGSILTVVGKIPTPPVLPFSIFATQLAQPLQIYPYPGSAYSKVGSVPIGIFPINRQVQGTLQSVPSEFPWSGAAYSIVGVVPVPFVQPPALVTAIENVPQPWPPPGFVLTYVSARPPFNTSKVPPTKMRDIYRPVQKITGRISDTVRRAVVLSRFGIEDSLVLDPSTALFTAIADGTYGYFAGGDPNFLVKAKIYKINLATLFVEEELTLSSTTIITSAISGNYGFFFGRDGVVHKIQLNTLTEVDTLAAQALPQDAIALGNYLYSFSATSPSVCQKLSMSPLAIADNLTLSTNLTHSSTTDGTYLYAASGDGSSQIQKINVAGFSLVSVLTTTASQGLTSACNDGTFAYFGSNGAGHIDRVRLSDFTQVDSLTIPFNRLFDAEIVGGYAYFASAIIPTSLVKIRLSDFTLYDSFSWSNSNLVFNVVLVNAGIVYLGTAYNLGSGTTAAEVLEVENP
jgi:hypothetical protein